MTVALWTAAADSRQPASCVLQLADDSKRYSRVVLVLFTIVLKSVSNLDARQVIFKMGNRSSLLLRDEEIAQIQEETGFTPNQIERLYSRFTSLDRGDCGTLSREDFLRIPELAINPLGDRIVHAFFEDGGDRVNFRQFMQVLARFRPIKKNKDNKLNSREQKLRFAFKMYDLDNDDKVSRDELLAILHMMVGANISEEQLTSIAERTIMEADQNGDQMISFEEFCKALERTDVEQKMSIRFLN